MDFFRIGSMKNDKRRNDEEILKMIKSLFGAEAEEDWELDDELQQFLDERIKLEQGDASWSLESFLQLYEKLKEYGLEEKLMDNLEFFIRLEIELNRDDFLKSEFYKKFKNHKIVSRAKRDSE